MTPPRQILPNSVFELDVRTIGRTFRFPAVAQVNQLFLYLFAVAAQRYDIVIYALVVMTNHYHLVGKDTHGKLPDFMCYLHSMLARSLNSFQGRDDKVWSGDGPTILRPAEDGDLWQRILYVLNNPVAADLVNCLADYPGVATQPSQCGVDVIVKRPAWFFRKNGPMPDSAVFRFEVPEQFQMETEEYVDELRKRQTEQERATRVERKADPKRAVLGTKRLLQTRVGDAPRNREKWFRMRPNIAAKGRVARTNAIRAMRHFRTAYERSRERWLRGEPNVVFPAGTYWLVRYAGAKSAAS